MAAVGLHCWEGFSPVAMSGGCTLVAVFRLLFLRAQALGMQASVAAAWALNSWGTQAWMFHRIEPVSPALAGEFLFTVPPGNSSQAYF